MSTAVTLLRNLVQAVIQISGNLAQSVPVAPSPAIAGNLIAVNSTGTAYEAQSPATVAGAALNTEPSIAALRAATTATLWQTEVVVLGYYAAADGGGGTYVYAPTDTTSADNGGTIIVDTSNRRWYLMTGGAPVSVLQFGAYGKCSADDSTAINKALAACAGKNTLLFPDGYTFTVNSQLNVPGGSSLILNGTILKAAGTSGNLFSVLSITGSSGKITGIGTIDGNMANQGASGSPLCCGIIATYPGYAPPYTSPIAQSALYTGWEISDITIQNCLDYAFYCALSGAEVRNVTFQNGGSAQFSYSFACNFLNCKVIGLTGNGLGFYLGNRECAMIGCTISDSTNFFILNDTQNIADANLSCSIIGCTANNCGIFVQGNIISPFQSLPNCFSDGHTISENTLYNSSFSILFAQHCVISGNVITQFGTLNVTDCRDLIFIGNEFYQNVSLAGAINRIKFVGNLIAGGSQYIPIFQVTSDNQPDEYYQNSDLVLEANTLYGTSSDTGVIAIFLQCQGSYGPGESQGSNYVNLIDNTFTGNITTVFSDMSSPNTSGLGAAAVFDGSQSVDNAANTKVMSQNLKVQGGTVTLLNLPTSDPHVVGELFRSGTTLLISNG